MVVLLEDFGALTGLTIVLLTTLLSIKYPIFDAFGSIFVGLLLISISYKLANEIRKLIVGESIPRNKRNEIKNIINEYSIVEHINRVQTMVIGNDKYLVLISIDVDNDSTGYQIEDVIDQIKVDIKKAIPEVETIYVEVQDMNRTLNS
jgi:divalent metal cation (Fe/Co/Zn/Cd) transporter